jgi:hypothetical protein
MSTGEHNDDPISVLKAKNEPKQEDGVSTQKEDHPQKYPTKKSSWTTAKKRDQATEFNNGLNPLRMVDLNPTCKSLKGTTKPPEDEKHGEDYDRSRNGDTHKSVPIYRTFTSLFPSRSGEETGGQEELEEELELQVKEDKGTASYLIEEITKVIQGESGSELCKKVESDSDVVKTSMFWGAHRSVHLGRLKKCFGFKEANPETESVKNGGYSKTLEQEGWQKEDYGENLEEPPSDLPNKETNNKSIKSTTHCDVNEEICALTNEASENKKKKMIVAVSSTSSATSNIKKRNTVVPYHRVEGAMATSVLMSAHCGTKTKCADEFSKFSSGHSRKEADVFCWLTPKDMSYDRVPNTVDHESLYPLRGVIAFHGVPLANASGDVSEARSMCTGL